MTLPCGKPKPTNHSGFPQTDALNRIAVLADRDYRTVFEASPDAILIVDSDGVIRDLNSQALGMFGWSRDDYWQEDDDDDDDEEELEP